MKQTSEDDGLDEGGFSMEEGIGVAQLGVAAPVFPVFFTSLGSLVSDAIGNALPCKQEITRQLNFFGTFRLCQDNSGGGESVC